MTPKKFLITGATGATGSNAIAKLVELKIPVRALVHKIDDRSKKLSALGAEIVEGDLSDFDAVDAALEGITGAYFVYPIQVPGIVQATAYFAQAALERGVGAIVNMSQITARRISKSHAARDHWIPPDQVARIMAKVSRSEEQTKKTEGTMDQTTTEAPKRFPVVPTTKVLAWGRFTSPPTPEQVKEIFPREVPATLKL